MRTFLGMAMAGMFTLALAGPARAQTQDPGVKDREVRQHERIQQGVRSGELTPRETHRLRREQRAIKGEEAAMKSDGVLTPAERAKLQHDQNRASRHIYRAKHNDREMPRAR